MNLNGKQIIAVCGAVLSVLMVSTSQLTDLFGPGVTKTVVSIAGLVNLILNSVTVAISTQGGLVKDVLAMPGVEKINVNASANQTLAAIAVDPTINKISPTPQAQSAVEATAKGGA